MNHVGFAHGEVAGRRRVFVDSACVFSGIIMKHPQRGGLLQSR